jgi:hypothetical protein
MPTERQTFREERRSPCVIALLVNDMPQTLQCQGNAVSIPKLPIQFETLTKQQ